MIKTITTQRIVIILSAPLLIFGIMMLIAQSVSFANNSSQLSLAITLDLLLTAPLVYYLLIRKTKIPRTTIIPVMITGMIVGTMILPTDNQYYFSLFKTWVLPIVEVAILAFVIYKVNKTIKRFKQKNKGSVDFMTALKNTCAEILPEKLVGFVATEIAVLYYGFVDWKKRKLNHNEFSYHKNGGSIALLGSIIFIIVIELLVAHILLAKLNVVVAWVLTCFSIYSCIQFWGFVRSMYKRPIAIKNGQLLLKHGIMTEVVIDICDIESVEISTKSIEHIEHARKLSFLGEMDSHNIIIRLRTERTLFGLYGINRSFKTIAFYVDDKETFVKALQAAIEHPEHWY